MLLPSSRPHNVTGAICKNNNNNNSNYNSLSNCRVCRRSMPIETARRTYRYICRRDWELKTDSWHKEEKLRCDVWTRCACLLLACSTGYPHGPYKVLYVNGSSRTVHRLPNTTRIITGCLSLQANVPHDLRIGFSPEVFRVFIYLFIYLWNLHWKLEGRIWPSHISLRSRDTLFIYLLKVRWKLEGNSRKSIYIATVLSYIIYYLWKPH
jgi:hypothetical protein